MNTEVKLTLKQWATRAILWAQTAAEETDIRLRDDYDTAQYRAHDARISGCPSMEADYEAQMADLDQLLTKVRDRMARIQRASDWLRAHNMWDQEMAIEYYNLWEV